MVNLVANFGWKGNIQYLLTVSDTNEEKRARDKGQVKSADLTACFSS